MPVVMIIAVIPLFHTLILLLIFFTDLRCADKLFFAGEAVNFPAGATAHAALESALRAAQLVAQALARRK